MEKLRMGVKCDSNDSPVASETVWHDAPHSWTRTSLRHVSRLQYGDSLADAERQEGDICVFGSNGPVGYHNQANMIAPAIVVGRKGSFGKVTFAPFGGFAIDTTYFIDKRSSRQNLRWLYYSLTTLGLDQISQDTGVPGLSREKAYEARLAVPPLPTQRAIADYLDEKTADLDALIEKKRKLLDLLAEERAALINQVVTKGLNPSVPMKDSGIPWIGEIPAHWEVTKLSYVVVEGPTNGISPPVTNDDSGIPSFSISVIRNGFVNVRDEDIKYVVVSECDARRFAIKLDDLLLVRGNGNINLVGLTGLVTSNELSGYVYPDLLMRMRCNQHIEPAFLRYCLNSHVVRPQMTAAARTTVGTYKVNNEQVRALKVLIPPRNEAQGISAKLDEQLSRQDAVVVKAEYQIDRLQEYRQALITAAVTGQLDLGAAA